MYIIIYKSLKTHIIASNRATGGTKCVIENIFEIVGNVSQFDEAFCFTENYRKRDIQSKKNTECIPK